MVQPERDADIAVLFTEVLQAQLVSRERGQFNDVVGEWFLGLTTIDLQLNGLLEVAHFHVRVRRQHAVGGV